MSIFYRPNESDESALVRFFRTASKQSIGDFFLKRIDRDQQIRKQITALVDEAIENMGAVKAAQFLREHAAELIGGEHEITPQREESPPGPKKPDSA